MTSLPVTDDMLKAVAEQRETKSDTAEESTFIRVMLADGTFKTLPASRNTTALQAISGLLQKLCRGPAIEEKIIQARNEYHNSWLYRVRTGTDTPALLLPSSRIWDHEGPPDFTLLFKLPTAEERATIVKMTPSDEVALDLLIESEASVSQTLVPVHINDKVSKNLLINMSMTASQAIEELLRQLCRGEVTSKKLEDMRHKYADRSIYVESNSSSLKLEASDKLWPFYSDSVDYSFFFISSKRDKKRKVKKTKKHIRQKSETSFDEVMVEKEKAPPILTAPEEEAESNALDSLLELMEDEDAASGTPPPEEAEGDSLSTPAPTDSRDSSPNPRATAEVERDFWRIDTANNTFKTLVITPDMKTSDAVELLYKKMCKGRVTEEKLTEAKQLYADYWLFVEQDTNWRKLSETELVWSLRSASIYWKPVSDVVCSDEPKKEVEKKKVDKDKKEHKLKLFSKDTQKEREKEKEKEKQKQEKAIKREKEKEAVKLKLSDIGDENLVNPDAKHMLRVDLPDNLFKTVIISPFTTGEEIIEAVYKKLVKGKVTDVALNEVREKYSAFSLFVIAGGFETKILAEDKIWCIITAKPPPEVQFKPEKGKLSMAEMLEVQAKQIRDLQKQLEKANQKMDAVKSQANKNTKKRVHKIRVDTSELEVQEKLGAVGGSFASVYAVSVDGWKCAMKEIDTLDLGAEEGVENEIDILQFLPSSKYVCKYLYHDRTDTKLRLFIELFAGTLRDVLNKYRALGKRFTPLDIKTFLSEIALGISHLHSNLVLHRDLKCDNIFITVNDSGNIQRCAVGDFDTSLRMKSANGVATDCIGTPSFIAPEVLNARVVGGYGFAADVYSFGMIIYELLTLQEPYEDCESMGEMSQKILDGVRPTVPAELKSEKYMQYHPFIDLFMRCTDFDPDLRPQMSELVLIFSEMPIGIPSAPPLPEEEFEETESSADTTSASTAPPLAPLPDLASSADDSLTVPSSGSPHSSPHASPSTSPRRVVPAISIAKNVVPSPSPERRPLPPLPSAAAAAAGTTNVATSPPPAAGEHISPKIVPSPNTSPLSVSPTHSPSSSPATSPRKKFPSRSPPAAMVVDTEPVAQ